MPDFRVTVEAWVQKDILIADVADRETAEAHAIEIFDITSDATLEEYVEDYRAEMRVIGSTEIPKEEE